MSDTPRLANIGKYMRDRYTSDLNGQKRAMVEAQINRASQEDLEKVALGPLLGPAVGWATNVGLPALAGAATIGGGLYGGKKLYDAFTAKPKSKPQQPGTYGLGQTPQSVASAQAKLDAARKKQKQGLGVTMRQTGQSAVGGPTAGGARAGQPGKKPAGGMNP